MGILAGGRATRLGGLGKAWLRRGGIPQVERIARMFGSRCDATLVSANAQPHRLAALGLRPIPDRIADAGPLGGLDALASACTTHWLFTIPVDAVNAEEALLAGLLGAGNDGAVAEDEEGLQPLVALYRVESLRGAIGAALGAGDYSVRAMQDRLPLQRVRFSGLRIGNLNTPADLLAAGIDP